MTGSASRSVTRCEIDAVGRAGRRQMMSARGALQPEGFRYAPENGLRPSFRRGGPFDEVLPSLVITRRQTDAEGWFTQVKFASLASPYSMPWRGRG